MIVYYVECVVFFNAKLIGKSVHMVFFFVLMLAFYFQLGVDKCEKSTGFTIRLKFRAFLSGALFSFLSSFIHITFVFFFFLSSFILILFFSFYLCLSFIGVQKKNEIESTTKTKQQQQKTKDKILTLWKERKKINSFWCKSLTKWFFVFFFLRCFLRMSLELFCDGISLFVVDLLFPSTQSGSIPIHDDLTMKMLNSMRLTFWNEMKRQWLLIKLNLYIP